MAESKNTFSQSLMNKDADSRVLPKGQYRDALNVRVGKSEGSDVGALENSLSNRLLTNFIFDGEAQTIGSVSDGFKDKIYWLVKDDSSNYVLEWDSINNSQSIILKDSRIGDNNVLNFSLDHLVTGINILIDSDNDIRFLCWTDNLNEPRQVNIERAKTYGENNFGENEISLMKKAPLEAPQITLGNTDDNLENNLEEKFLSFSYRYKYLDGEYSALSPFSPYAFKPKPFNFDFSISSNESMVNTFNKVDIEINTGSNLVTDIEIVFKESESNLIYVIEKFNKNFKSWADDSLQTFEYSNNKIKGILPEDEIKRIYDNVPKRAKGQELIGNRLVYANYTENDNIEDCNGNSIEIDLELNHSSEGITEGLSENTMKSNREYESGIAYLDSKGRLTTVLTSEGNTQFIPNSDASNKNKLNLKIKHKAPCFATHYRIFVRQPKTDYDTIVPTLFYQDGVYVWIKLEGNDINKVKEGEFIYVKSDSTDLLDSAVKTRVLEVTSQPRNFLDLTGSNTLLQLSGNYFKIKPSGFRMNPEDFTNHVFESFDSSANRNDNPIRDNQSYVENPVFNGDTLNDLSYGNSNYTSLSDRRFLIEIDSVGDGMTTFDTFRWSIDNGANYAASNVVITAGSPIPLISGLEIIFNSDIGHSLNDSWIASAKAERDDNLGGDENSKSYGLFRGIAGEEIQGGARINIRYDEYGEESQVVDKTYISSKRYDNLEEWFYGDNILPDFVASGIPENRIWFRKGNYIQDGNAGAISIDPTGSTFMIIRSKATQNNDLDERNNIRSFINIFQGNTILFETIPVETNSDIFFEGSETYEIQNGFHLGKGLTDSDQNIFNPAELTLPLFNSFAWGNGFESYKIKDLLTGKTMGIDTRPLSTVDEYRENKRISSLTYGGIYEQSTNFNGLNEFNLALANFKDLDDKYGEIQKIFSRDTNLISFQEDKVLNILYNKSILYNADGSGNVSQNLDVLGQEVPYAGEYGISCNPESFSFYGNQIYFTDSKRGCLMRLSLDGLTEISRNGMEDWFRDNFRNNPKTKKIGKYDPYFDQYTLTLYGGNNRTLTFDEGVSGFTSFHSFIPDWMERLNNRFFSMKGGQLYIHNDENSNIRNNFYGEQYPTKITYVLNDAPSEIKVVKTLNTESNKPFFARIRSYLNNEILSITESTIKTSEFLNKEGKWYAYVRRNELFNDLSAKDAYGLGRVDSISGNIITMQNSIPSSLIRSGDNVLNESQNSIGIIESYTGNTITLTANPFGITNGSFILGKKSGRIEGSDIRGYNFEIELTDETNTRTEIFAASSELFKSYPS